VVVLDADPGLETLEVSFDVYEADKVYEQRLVQVGVLEEQHQHLDWEYGHDVEQKAVPTTHIAFAHRSQLVYHIAVLVVITHVEVHPDLRQQPTPTRSPSIAVNK